MQLTDTDTAFGIAQLVKSQPETEQSNLYSFRRFIQPSQWMFFLSGGRLTDSNKRRCLGIRRA